MIHTEQGNPLDPLFTAAAGAAFGGGSSGGGGGSTPKKTIKFYEDIKNKMSDVNLSKTVDNSMWNNRQFAHGLFALQGICTEAEWASLNASSNETMGVTIGNTISIEVADDGENYEEIAQCTFTGIKSHNGFWYGALDVYFADDEVRAITTLMGASAYIWVPTQFSAEKQVTLVVNATFATNSALTSTASARISTKRPVFRTFGYKFETATSNTQGE